MSNFKKIFKTENPVIGMIHFMPLLGYSGYPGIDEILNKALKDLKALEKGRVDGIIIENNYDIPHKITVEPETITCLTYLAKEIIKETKLPVGISVLWNDYKTALSVAKICGAKFVRVPVFTDNVRTNYGDIFGNAKDVVLYRKKIKAQEIAVFTDIHVKHAILLSNDSLADSARKAVNEGSDAIIITGKWTADAPNVSDLKEVRESVNDFPVLIGSGARKENIVELLKYANGVIVGTSIKTGVNNKKNVNIRGYNERIDVRKVKDFVKKFKESKI